MPPKFRKDFHDLLEKMSVQVGSYIQGQIIVSFCIDYYYLLAIQLLVLVRLSFSKYCCSN